PCAAVGAGLLLRPVKGGIAAGAQAGAEAFVVLAIDRLAAGDARTGASLPLGALAAELALDQVLDLGPSRFELKHGLSEFDERIEPPRIGASAGGLPGRVVDGPDRCPARSGGVRARGGERESRARWRASSPTSIMRLTTGTRRRPIFSGSGFLIRSSLAYRGASGRVARYLPCSGRRQSRRHGFARF